VKKVPETYRRVLNNSILLRVLQFTLCICGILILVFALSDLRFRNAEGFLRGTFCLPLSISVGLMLLGCALAGLWKRTAFWFVLALVGQAVALQMIDAGPYVRYQHYKSLSHLLTETHSLLLAYFSIQTILVVVGLKHRWHSIRNWIGQNFKPWQVLGVSLVFILSSATVSREIQFYLVELFFAAFIQAVNLANIVLMAWALPEETLVSFRQKFDKLFGQPGVKDRGLRTEDLRSIICNPQPIFHNPKGEPGCVDRFAIVAAIWVVILAIVLNFISYERHPHVPDEVVYLYHAHYLADAMLTVPAPPVPEAFSIYMIPYESERWYSIFPPGWPAMLAIGTFFGAPWIVNPLLAGLNVLLAYILVGEIYSRRTARIVVFLLCFSPWHVFMAMNFMAHTFTLTCALAAAAAISRARRTNKAIWGWLSGVMTGVVSLIRPLDGLMVAGLLGLWAIGVGGRRLKFSSIAGFLGGAIVVGAIVLPYNKQITGNVAGFPLTAYYERYYGPKVNALGFGPERGLGWAIDAFPGHSPLEALINANLNISSVNLELFGWSTGSLFLAALLFFSRTMERRDHLMFTVILAILGIYSLYWFSGGADFGARYWYLMLVPVVCLTARGIQFLEGRFQPESDGFNRAGTRVMVAVLSLCIFTFVNYFAWRAIDKYHHYRGMRPDIRYLAREHSFGKSLVLIRGKTESDYLSAWTYNPLDPFADAAVYAWDRNPQVRAKILEAYPDRPVWIVNGPTVTKRGYEVAEGPLSELELVAKENEN